VVYEGGGDDYGGRKVKSVQNIEDEDYDDYQDEKGYDDRHAYDDDEGQYEEDERGNLKDTRPIRPKATNKYDDRDPEVDPDGYDAKDDRGQNFPAGEHPLEGVSNLADLPAPEELRGANK
jgi:hypothetical protein